jgi:hypothetical protein
LPRAAEAVVVDLAIGHPDGEDAAAGDAPLEAGLAFLPAAAGIEEFAIVDVRLLHAEGAQAAPHCFLDTHVVEVQVGVVPTEDGTVQLRAVQREAGDGRVLGVPLQADQVGVGIQPFEPHLGVGQRLGGRLPAGRVRDRGLVHAGAAERHARFEFERSVEFELAFREFDGVAVLGGLHRGHEFGRGFQRLRRGGRCDHG